MMFNFKLRGQLLLPILLVIIIGITGIQIISYGKTSRSMENLIKDSVVREVDFASSTINDWIQTMTANVINWGRNPIYLDALTGNPDAIEAVMGVTEEALQDFPWYEGVGLIGTDGNVIAAYPDSYATMDISDRDYFKASMNGFIGKSKALKSRATGNPILVISAPILEEGDVKGVLFVVVSIMDLYDKILAPIKIGESGYAFATDSKGLIIGHQNRDYVLELDISNRDFGKVMLQDLNGTFKYYFDEESQWKLMAFSHVEEADWLIAITAPLGELMGSLKSIRDIAVIGAVLTLLLIAFIVMMTVRKITRNIFSFSSLLGLVAEGDLTITMEDKVLKGGDEIADMARSLNTVIPNLHSTIHDIQESASYVTSGSLELSNNSTRISQGASEQASSIEEVSASIEEMVASITQNAENSTQTERIASQAAIDAEEGGKSVVRSIDAMKSIADKISIIGEIARQTNMLALNAAIEAARAGEHGKGFAVVASEIRKLAERSSVAATEIGDLSSTSVEIVEKAGALLDKIVPDIKKTAELVQEISSASREQSSGVDQINTAIQQLERTTQSNAADSEAMAATSEELSGQAEQMQRAISFFKVENTQKAITD